MEHTQHQHIGPVHHHEKGESTLPEGKLKSPESHPSHDEHMGHHTEDFLKRFWVCLILTIPVILLSEMVQHWFGYRLTFPGARFTLFGFSLIIFLYGGKPFL
ncbi:MAG TPA: heavy metal translocating P-type ATPase, partial [Emticicia sp.]